MQLDKQEESSFVEWMKSIYEKYSRADLNFFEHNLEVVVWRERWRKDTGGGRRRGGEVGRGRLKREQQTRSGDVAAMFTACAGVEADMAIR